MYKMLMVIDASIFIRILEYVPPIQVIIVIGLLGA